jgi:hypothetical protein
MLLPNSPQRSFHVSGACRAEARPFQKSFNCPNDARIVVDDKNQWRDIPIRHENNPLSLKIGKITPSKSCFSSFPSLDHREDFKERMDLSRKGERLQETPVVATSLLVPSTLLLKTAPA